MKFIALIPARGGSMGIPNKNLIKCGMYPLIDYTINAALGSKYLSGVYASTDSKEIAAHCISRGVEAPFLRPVEISGSESPMIDVVEHFLNWCRDIGRSIDALVLLQPTSPLRNAHHIDLAIKQFLESGCNSLVSLVEVPHNFRAESQYEINDKFLKDVKDSNLRHVRQNKTKNYSRNGPAILISNAKLLLSNKKFYHEPTSFIIMDKRSSIDVDDSTDLEIANLLLLSNEK
jgi:CMP-N-acetylneuraminic acid synthetase